MNKITVMKFPPYYSKKDVKKITKVNPDILIFDNDFFTTLDNFTFPDSIVYLEFGKRFNKSLKYVDLPKYLKKLRETLSDGRAAPGRTSREGPSRCEIQPRFQDHRIPRRHVARPSLASSQRRGNS